MDFMLALAPHGRSHPERNRVYRAGACPGSLCLPAALLAVMLLAFPAARAAQNNGPFRLAGVTVVGSERYTSADIVKATGLQIAAGVTLEQLKQAADRLAALGVFARVGYRYETRGETLTAVFTVQDTPDMLPCRFDNLVWFTPAELQQDLRAHVPLYDGLVPPGGSMVSLVSARLEGLLAARGLHARVNSSPQASLGGRVLGISFEEKGVALPVRKVEFTGVQKIDPALLQKAAQPLLNQNYDASFIEDYSAGALTDVYRRLGYLRARLGAPVPHLLAGAEGSNPVAVTLPVVEGQAYTLKQIAWSGESAIPYPKLAKLLHAKIGKPVNAVQMDQDVLGLILPFHPLGYLHADVQSKAVLDDASHTAVYQIQIRQGDVYRLGTLDVAGVDASTARAIVKMSRLKPGDPYNADYWSMLVRQAIPLLPSVESGWKARASTYVHADTKTVDVRLIFAPNLSR